MTEIEVAELVIKQDGSCCEQLYIDCDDCPADRIRIEKRFGSCVYLWDDDNDNKKIWFEKWLSEVKR